MWVIFNTKKKCSFCIVKLIISIKHVRGLDFPSITMNSNTSLMDAHKAIFF